MKILLATRNKHKVREISKIIDMEGLEFATLQDYPETPEVVEDRETFTGNSTKKARCLAKSTGLTAMADDSGLEVRALGGEPGVYSARYAAEHGNDMANNRKLIENLHGVADRSARFRCVISLASPDGNCESVEGTCEGVIALQPYGENGFGYDPVFIPQGYDKTFAQLDPEIKNRISHRARALHKARQTWFQGR